MRQPFPATESGRICQRFNQFINQPLVAAERPGYRDNPAPFCSPNSCRCRACHRCLPPVIPELRWSSVGPNTRHDCRYRCSTTFIGRSLLPTGWFRPSRWQPPSPGSHRPCQDRSPFRSTTVASSTAPDRRWSFTDFLELPSWVRSSGRDIDQNAAGPPLGSTSSSSV